MPDPVDLAYAIGLPPKDAIAYLAQRGRELPTGMRWQDVWQRAHARAFTVAGVMKADVLGDIHASLVDARTKGLGFTDWEKSIVPTLEKKGWYTKTGPRLIADPATGELLGKKLTPARMRLIYDQNMQTAYMAGRHKQMKANAEFRPWWQYTAVMDGRTRPAHRALNGRTFRHDDPFWDSFYPPNGFRCFPAGVEVRADAQIGLKTWYAGEMVQFKTRLGNDLTLTANHPVLTRRGWMQANMLQQGDQVLSDGVFVDAPVQGVVNHQQPPARVEDLFEALTAQGLRVVPMAAHDFHGDAFLREPEIHVAGADRHLVHELKPQPQQRVGQRQLGPADAVFGMHPDRSGGAAQPGLAVGDAVNPQDATDVAQAGAELPADGPLGNQPAPVDREHAPLQVGVAVAGGLVGSAELPGHGGGIGLDGRPLEALRVGSAAQRDAAQAEQTAERAPAAFGLFGELLEANPGLVLTDEIVEVCTFDWAGHVYDFQTETGLMVAGGLIVHNCRCSVRAFGDADIEARGIPTSSSAGRLDSVRKPIDKRGSATAAVARYRPIDGPPVTVDVGFNANLGARAWNSDRTIRRAVIERVPKEQVLPILKDVATQHARIADYQGWVREVLDSKQVFGTSKVIGYLAPQDEAFMAGKGHRIADGAITLEDRLIAGPKAGRHETKGDALTRDEWLKLPVLLARPAAVLYQVDRGTLLYVMDALDASGRRIKVAVEAARVEKGIEPAEIVRTAFKVNPITLRDAVKGGRMELVRGKL